MARRKKNQGRHYSADEALEFWLDGFAESEEVDSGDVHITSELQDAWDNFGFAVQESLDKHLGEAKTEEIYDSEGFESVTSDVYATLAGHGVGIWDGRWDGYLSKSQIESLQKKLDKDLGKYVDDAGGGSLNEAFMEAVWAARSENPSKSTKALKNKLLK